MPPKPAKPTKPRITKMVLQRMLNAARAFRELSDVPSVALPTSFATEADARAALVDTTLHEAHHAFLQPIAAGAHGDLTLHALDLQGGTPGIVEDGAGGQLRVFRQTLAAPDTASEPTKVRAVRRPGVLRVAASMAQLEERRAAAAVERRDRPKRAKGEAPTPKPARAAAPAEPTHEQAVGDLGAPPKRAKKTKAAAPAERPTARPTDGVAGAAPDPASGDAPGSDVATDAVATDAVAAADPKTAKRRRAKPAAPPVETTVTITSESLASEHSLYECPTSWVQRLRVLGDEAEALHPNLSAAVTRGHPSDALRLIVGPPGTGKSVRLIELAAERARSSQCRVLLTAPTNLAACDLYRRLVEAAPDLTPVLAMRAERVVGAWSDRLANGRHDPESAEADAARLVVATASTVTLACMRRAAPFECILVDEAGLLDEVSTWCLLRSATTELVLCGDPAQLEALVSEPGRALAYGRSMFRRLLELSYPAERLGVQRRMHPEIAALAIRRFYPELTSDYSPPLVGAGDWRAELLGLRVIESEGAEEASGTSWINRWEARRGLEAAAELRGALPARSSVVLLVPYAAQADLCRRTCPQGVEVATVDSFQGREADAVVLLMVRSGPRGFWHAEGRVCVALTRARHHMTVVASREWALGG